MEKNLFVKRKPIKCPNCGFKPIAVYQYGEPYYTPELVQDLENNKIILGGCCFSDDSPLWHCTNCNSDFFRES